MKAGTSNFASFQPSREQGNTVTVEPSSAVRSLDTRQAPAIRLTPRELEVLALLCEGLPNKLISRRLDISSATVKCHISRILSELGVSSRLQAVVAAARQGLVRESSVAASGATLANARHASYGGLQGSVRAGSARASL
jgi:DNA-binding CsgD family transcriptional regulator